MSDIKEVVQKIMEVNFKFDTDVSVLVVTDMSTKDLGSAFHQALHELGWETYIHVMEDRNKSGEEPDAHIAKEMLNHGIVFCLTKHSLTHTVARRHASEQGISVITMPGINEDIFLHGAINADYDRVEQETNDIVALLTSHEKVTIESGDGLTLRIPIGERKGVPSTGVFHKKGDSGNLPSGEAYIAPLEGEAEGEIEINGSIAGIGLVYEPVILKIAAGRLVHASGEVGKKLMDILGEGDGRLLAELGIGTNHAARVTGNILEDEKAKNTIHVAFGSNHTFGGVIKTDVHIDCVTKSPGIIWES